jgi:PAS domain S-box-containing protein
VSATIATDETRTDLANVPSRSGGRRIADSDWLGLAINAAGWAIATAFAFWQLEHEMGVALALVGAICMVVIAALHRWTERKRWVDPIHQILHRLQSQDNPEEGEPDVEVAANPELAELARAVKEIKEKLTSMREVGLARVEGDINLGGSGEFEVPKTAFNPMLSRSSFHDPPVGLDGDGGDEIRGEMINRLDPKTLRWLESSPAEQAFLGWPLVELRRKSFLEIIDNDDRELAKTQLAAAIAKGEGHNLLYRVRTASNEVRAVELHVAVRYSTDARPHHVRIRFADMTKKVRAERELRRRTKELIDVNGQLRRINRELEHLKNRYSDLYQNAPAMYFSLDGKGTIVECNDTLLETLGRTRASVVGKLYLTLLPEDRRNIFASWFHELRKSGRVELEGRWVKSNGEEIDVWLTSTAVRGTDGSFRYSRSVGRDVTARRALEAEINDKNDRLARANAELSRKNKELDEFTYIIAHDLKEPLRTLIAFSGFLEKDCGAALDQAGKDYLRHIVDAARRMRSLINDLQTLGRAGRVAGDFSLVKIEVVVQTILADYAELLRSRCAVVEVKGDLPDVWGDPVRISQLFANLIGNGLKYNRSRCPRVEVAPAEPPEDKRQVGFATLAVRDNGIGIESRFHTKIFELFRRLHTREEYDGTGAGLAICQKIAQAHGGRIWLESIPGSGSTFFVTLPLPPGPAPKSDVDSNVS